MPLTLPNAAGEFPLANATLSVGPIGLLPLVKEAEAFKVQLVSADGAPAGVGVPAFLRAPLTYIDFSEGAATAKGLTVVETESDNSGIVAFPGMPNFRKLAGLAGEEGVSDAVRIVVPPYPATDPIPQFFGKEVVFNVNRLQGTIPTIILSSDGKPNQLQIDATNIPALAGQSGNRMAPTGSVHATFNMPLDASLTQVEVYDEDGKMIPDASVSKSISGNLFTITVKNSEPGSEYNINIRAFATVEGALYEKTFSAPFFIPSQAGAAFDATLSRATGNPEKIVVSFSEPVGTGVAGKSFAGGNAILYFNTDLDGSGTTGDAVNEAGYTSSSVGLFIDETNPPGPAGLSGFSSTWTFTLPLDNMGNPVPTGTAINFSFSEASLVMQKPNSERVEDLKLFVP
jgi:hypothetical protein